MIYQAIYFDKYKSGDNRVVFVEPLFIDYNTAYYVLQSYKYSIFPGVVLQFPSNDNAQKFSDEINKISLELSKDSVEKMYDAVINYIKNDNDFEPILMWKRSPNEVKSSITLSTSEYTVCSQNQKNIVSGAKIPLPTELVMPAGINVRCKNIWKFVIRNYREKIRSYPKAEEQWTAAIIIFKRVCYKNNLRPFVKVPVAKNSPDVVEDERNKLVKKIKDGFDKSEMLLLAIMDNFISYGWASKLSDEWKYNGIEKATTFSGMLFKELILYHDKTYKDVNNYLNKNEGFKKLSYENAELNIDSVTSIIFQKHNSKPNYMFVIIKFSFDKRMAHTLLTIDEKATNDDIMKEINRWVTDTFIKV